MFSLLERIQVDGESATIRYIGHLPKWGEDVTCLGVEWDNPIRGKNNGEVDGVCYFVPAVPGSASFVKSTNKKIKKGVPFVSALLDQYYNEGDQENAFGTTIVFGSKVVQPFGFEKLNRIQSDFLNLSSVSLDKKCVSTMEGDQSVIGTLVNVTHLDLSYNLFDMDLVLSLIPQLPSLNLLNLNGNRLEMSASANNHLSNLTTLKLSDTKISISSVNRLVQSLPHLSNLQLSSNNYTDADIESLQIGRVSSLDLSFNKLTAIPQIPVSTLILSDNQISHISGSLPTVISLDIRYNVINDWTTIDQISSVFPSLKSLKCNANPLFESLPLDLMSILVTARVSDLQTLNGSNLKPDEISNAELYFISQVQQQKIIYNTDLPRWKNLLAKYNKQDITLSKPSKLSNKLSLNLSWQNQKTERTFLLSNSVLKLKGTVSRLTGVNFLSICLYYYINEFEESEFRMKSYLEDNTSSLDQCGFQEGQTIHVEVVSN